MTADVVERVRRSARYRDVDAAMLERLGLPVPGRTARDPRPPGRTADGYGPRERAALDGFAGFRVPGGYHWQEDTAGARFLLALGEDGALREVGAVPTTTHRGHVQPSEIAVRADGRFLYVANRGPDTIAVFSVDDPLPRYVGEMSTGGRWPRHFAIIDDYLYVANERSHSVGIFRLHPENGLPISLGDPVDTPSPTCIAPE